MAEGNKNAVSVHVSVEHLVIIDDACLLIVVLYVALAGVCLV